MNFATWLTPSLRALALASTRACSALHFGAVPTAWGCLGASPTAGSPSAAGFSRASWCSGALVERAVG